MPLPTRIKLSLLTYDEPLVARFAPFALTEFAQPLPAEPLLPHGHGVPAPVPKQYGVAEGWHSSGMPSWFASWLVPLAMSHASSMPFWLQSTIVPVGTILNTLPVRSQM